MCDERGTRRRVRWQALAGLRVRAGGSARRRRVALVVGAPRGAGHQRQDAASTPPKARKRRRDRDGEAWPRTLASPETVNHKTTTIGTTDIHTFRRWLSRLYTPPTESMWCGLSDGGVRKGVSMRQHPLSAGVAYWSDRASELESQLADAAGSAQLVRDYRTAVRRKHVAKRKYELWRAGSRRSCSEVSH